MKEFFFRIISGIVYVSLVILSLFLPPPFFLILFGCFTIVCIYEYLRMVNKISIYPNHFLTYFFAVLTFLLLQLEYLNFDFGGFFNIFQFVFFAIIGASLAGCILEIFRNKTQKISNIASTIFPLIWIACPFGLIGYWAFSAQCINIILALFIITCTYDILAYCFGSLFGKHPMAKKISPHKTWEGLIASLIVTIGLSLLFMKIPFFQDELINTPLRRILFALIIITFGTFGDLVESMIKRTAHVKDSGKILPGHGGLLDRCDSLLFSIPAGFFFYIILFQLS